MLRSTISPTTARSRLVESFGHSRPAGRSPSRVDPCRVASYVARYHAEVARLRESIGACEVAGEPLNAVLDLHLRTATVPHRISSFATAHRDRERERRACSHLTLDPDLAAVELDELS